MVEVLEQWSLESKKNLGLPLFVLRMERLSFIVIIKSLQSGLHLALDQKQT